MHAAATHTESVLQLVRKKGWLRAGDLASAGISRPTRARSACAPPASRSIPGEFASSLAWGPPYRDRPSQAVDHRVGTMVGSAMHRRPRTGMNVGGRDRGHQTGRPPWPADASKVCSLRGLLVNLKKSTQVSAEHFCRAPPRTSKCKPCAHLDGRARPPGWTGIRLGSSVTRCFPLEGPPYHQGARGHRLGSGAAPQRGDKAHGRLEGGRRRLGYVMTPPRGGAHRRRPHVGSACDLEGVDDWIDRGRASPRLARHGSRKEPGAGAGHDR